MKAKEKLESLSHSWMGYAVCSSLFSVFGLRASGMVSFAIGFTLWAVINAVLLAITLGVIAFFGRKLASGSSATRSFLIFVSGLFAVLGVLNLANEGRAFLSYWSLALILQMAATAVSVFMNARSFAILNSATVRAHFVD